MTDNRKDTQSRENPGSVKDLLKAIADTLNDGHIPEDLVSPDDEEARGVLGEILSDIVTTQKFALDLAHGDLSQDLTVKGYMAGSLKFLQSSLRHLTWQAEQIAGGDLSQRVHFMGQFSDSFNAMIGHLSANETYRKNREEELRKVNADLVREVCERKKMEDALRLANKKITMLSSITRHDIRNQLMALRGFLELSRLEISDPVVLEYMKKEDRAAEAIGKQIEFTKYFEDIGVNAPEWQDISRLVHSAQSQLPPLDKVEVIIDLPPVKVFADGLIEKVLYNLMENTLRHGERVSLIRFSFSETETGAEIVYEDNGVGISREDKPHLFEKGFGKNTGLGLFLSQEILAITGLTIRETGEPGKGVRFAIAIPKEGYRFPGLE